MASLRLAKRLLPRSPRSGRDLPPEGGIAFQRQLGVPVAAGCTPHRQSSRLRQIPELDITVARVGEGPFAADETRDETLLLK